MIKDVIIHKILLIRRREEDACGRSRDRNRHGGPMPPQRKGFRPARNRAIVYTLIETGTSRTAITCLNLVDIDFDRQF